MKKRQEGSAMIIVMCVMVITMALALSLLLISSVMMMNATRANQKEQCRITAVSVSEVVIEEIKKFEYTGSPIPSPTKTGLEGKLQTVGTTEWYAYDKYAGSIEQIMKKDKDYFSYELSGTDLPGKTVLSLYWINESGLDITNPEDEVKAFRSLVLYVKVTNTVGEESATILSSFHPLVNKGKDENGNEDETIGDWFWEYDGHQWERGDS